MPQEERKYDRSQKLEFAQEEEKEYHIEPDEYERYKKEIYNDLRKQKQEIEGSKLRHYEKCFLLVKNISFVTRRFLMIFLI